MSPEPRPSKGVVAGAAAFGLLALASAFGAWLLRGEGGQLFWMLAAGAVFLAGMAMAVVQGRSKTGEDPRPLGHHGFAPHYWLLGGTLVLGALVVLVLIKLILP